MKLDVALKCVWRFLGGEMLRVACVVWVQECHMNLAGFWLVTKRQLVRAGGLDANFKKKM